nr:MAG TPA: hypothetical protein [Bacteriophage sp.]DAN12521.1 MAG TPA: hypothetical protein [Bacteriophage sp.]
MPNIARPLRTPPFPGALLDTEQSIPRLLNTSTKSSISYFDVFTNDIPPSLDIYPSVSIKPRMSSYLYSIDPYLY